MTAPDAEQLRAALDQLRAAVRAHLDAIRPALEQLLDAIRAHLEAVRPAVEAAARNLAALAEQLRAAGVTGPRRDRPAWQSPYGPPRPPHRA